MEFTGPRIVLVRLSGAAQVRRSSRDSNPCAMPICTRGAYAAIKAPIPGRGWSRTPPTLSRGAASMDCPAPRPGPCTAPQPGMARLEIEPAAGPARHRCPLASTELEAVVGVAVTTEGWSAAHRTRGHRPDPADGQGEQDVGCTTDRRRVDPPAPRVGRLYGGYLHAKATPSIALAIVKDVPRQPHGRHGSLRLLRRSHDHLSAAVRLRASVPRPQTHPPYQRDDSSDARVNGQATS